MTKINEIELKRVNLNLPIHIVNKVNDYARSLGINNTSAYIILLNQALEQRETLRDLPKIFSTLNQLTNFMPKDNVLPLVHDNDNDSNN